jgi:hypothetical protein
VRISVALCTSDDASTLPSFLESLLAQTRAPDELVVRDDRSMDDTVAIVRAFDAPFGVRIEVNERRLGPGVNHGVVLNDCAGDVIAIASATHTWLPTRLELAAAAFEADALMGSVFCNGTTGDATFWDAAGFNASRRRAAGDGELPRLIAAYPFLSASTAMIRSDLREIVSPVPEHVSFDWWMTTLVLLVRRYALVDEPLVRATRVEVPAPTGVMPDEDPAVLSIRHHLRAIGAKMSVRDTDLHRQGRRAQAAFYGSVLDRFMTRAEPYLDRHDLLPIESADVAVHEIRERTEHLRVRGDLPDKRTRRIRRVFRELRTGRYTRYSSGLLSAFQDLVY